MFRRVVSVEEPELLRSYCVAFDPSFLLLLHHQVRAGRKEYPLTDSVRVLVRRAVLDEELLFAKVAVLS